MRQMVRRNRPEKMVVVVIFEMSILSLSVEPGEVVDHL
jgi:hypothetical protein